MPREEEKEEVGQKHLLQVSRFTRKSGTLATGAAVPLNSLLRGLMGGRAILWYIIG